MEPLVMRKTSGQRRGFLCVAWKDGYVGRRRVGMVDTVRAEGHYSFEEPFD